MFLFVFLLIIRIQLIMTDPNCIYDVDDGLKLDLRTLGLDNERGPKYDRITNIGLTQPTFNWNGCFPYSKTDNGNCTNAAACFTDSISNTSIIIAKQTSFRFEYHHGSSIISYENLNVFLICRDEDDDSATAFQDDSKTYNIYIQSRCCCPGMCHYSIHSISSIIILMIIIIIFLFGYILGSIIFLRHSLNLAKTNRYLCFDCSFCISNRNTDTDYQNI